VEGLWSCSPGKELRLIYGRTTIFCLYKERKGLGEFTPLWEKIDGLFNDWGALIKQKGWVETILGGVTFNRTGSKTKRFPSLLSAYTCQHTFSSLTARDFFSITPWDILRKVLAPRINHNRPLPIMVSDSLLCKSLEHVYSHQQSSRGGTSLTAI